MTILFNKNDFGIKTTILSLVFQINLCRLVEQRLVIPPDPLKSERIFRCTVSLT